MRTDKSMHHNNTTTMQHETKTHKMRTDKSMHGEIECSLWLKQVQGATIQHGSERQKYRQTDRQTDRQGGRVSHTEVVRCLSCVVSFHVQESHASWTASSSRILRHLSPVHHQTCTASSYHRSHQSLERRRLTGSRLFCPTAAPANLQQVLCIVL